MDGVSFRTDAGEIYGLRGPNGAGNTTTMAMMSGLLPPEEGRVAFDGIDQAPRSARGCSAGNCLRP